MNISVCLVVLSAFLVLAYEAEGQIAPTARFGAGVYAGGSLPLADFTDSAKAGYHVGGMVDAAVNNILDVRIDVVFNKLSDKTLTEGTTFREIGTNLLFGTFGAKLHAPRESASDPAGNAISPYLQAGVGTYKFRFDFVCRGPECAGPERNEQSETNLGFNLGAGATVPVRGIRAFFQVGYHAILPKDEQNGGKALILASFGLQLQ